MDLLQLDAIVNTSPLVEAAIQLSKNGLPLAWRCRINVPVEEITSIAAGLFSMGFELELIPSKPAAQLSIETDHGAMLVRTLADNTLILILSARGCSLQTLEIKLDEMFIKNPLNHHKEISNGKNGEGNFS
jgi:predicted regulator of Ras-like GTPase activity (Roadblock/LC7/MglB family)